MVMRKPADAARLPEGDTKTATGVFALIAAVQIDFLLPVLGVLCLLLLDATLCAWRLVKGEGNGKSIEHRSGIWTLVLYLNLGLIPLACKLWLPK